MTHEDLTTAVEELEALVNTGSDYAQAETQARLLLAEAGIENEPELHCKVLHALSNSLYRRGLSQEALPFAEQVLSLAQDNHLKDLEARALNIIGLVHQNLSDYGLALEYYGKALALSEELGNKSGVAAHLGNIGTVHYSLSDYGLALEYYGKALAVSEELGSKAGVAIRLGNIGIVHRNLSDYRLALEYYGKAVALDEELGNKAGVARHLGNIGVVHMYLSDYGLALEYYGKALALDEELGNKAGVAIHLGNIGNVHMYLSDYGLALEYYGKAVALAEELGYQAVVANNLGNIGTTYAKPEFEGYDPGTAEEYLFKALALLEEIGAKQNLYELHKNLAKLYEQQERWKESQTHYKKYHEIEKEVQTEEAKKESVLMEQRRKIEEAERDRQVNLARFQEREKILDNILPSQITERLIRGEQPIADKAENVSVFFSDIVGFTILSQKISAKELVSGLNELFIQYDIVAQRHGLEKIKTIGDAYMAVCGIPVFMENHAERMAVFALDIQELFKKGIRISGHKVDVRIGLHCGEVVAGVIGEQKFAYDLWGDAVNTAARMESHGEAGKIHVSEEFMHSVDTHGRAYLSLLNNVQFISRGEIEIKGKGKMRTYFLEKI